MVCPHEDQFPCYEQRPIHPALWLKVGFSRGCYEDRRFSGGRAIVLLFAWEALARFGIIDASFLSMPSEILSRFATCKFAAAPAVLYGVVLSVSRIARLVFQSLV
jgi:ABC-type nitrate/sulfonate/bicarbonate transport system permease component